MTAHTIYKSLQKPAFASSFPLSLLALGVGFQRTFALLKPVAVAGIVGDGVPASCAEAALNSAAINNNTGGTLTRNSCNIHYIPFDAVTDSRKLSSIDG